MAEEFVMPKLGLTMETGTIVGWLVDDGAEVVSGQPLLVIETDKVESEVEATNAGRLHRVGEIGQEYPCGAHIGWFLASGEQVPAGPVSSASVAADSGTTPAATADRTAAAAASVSTTAMATHEASNVGSSANTGVGGRLLASPNARRLAAKRGVDLWAIVGSGPGGRITSEDVLARPAAVNGGQSPGVISQPGVLSPPGAGPVATAAARNLADLLGVDLSQVVATGTDPRIGRHDVALHVRGLLASLTAPPTPAPPFVAPPPSLTPAAQDPSAVVPLTGMRGTIAKRMSQSLHSMAQLTLTMDVGMDAVVADRERRKAAGGTGPLPGYTDYVLAATARALVEHPHVNSQITDEGVALLPQVNVGLAVALDDGLIVPVINDTPSLDLEALSAETSRLADAARAAELTLPELQGGTFSVTALGMFEVDGFTPIINAPNTAILGVGRLRDDVAWSDDGQAVRARRLTLSLTWDHRAFDGAPAAEFTRAIKLGLEAVGSE